MFQRTTLELSQAGGAGKLVLDYLDGKTPVRPLYRHPPTPDGFTALLKERPYAAFNRKTLVEVLHTQAGLAENTSTQTLDHIGLLGHEGTYTVTTGHQLCLFTGPLYFIYKIATTIRLAKELSARFKSNRFVPVYWLASEDHDFEEINHFNTSHGTVRWETAQKGAVGRFATKELHRVWPEVQSILGSSENGIQLAELFREAYLNHSTLSHATRYLVNALFGDYGVVTLDGDEPVFKKQFVPDMRKDLFEGVTCREIENTISGFPGHGYEAQVKPRQVNLFLLTREGRHRIDRKDDKFVSGAETLTRSEIEKLLEESPEKFSPNVSLRGLYQQRILPNLAYVGGPGELSYWLEYKRMFDTYQVEFPILVPRNSFTLIDEDRAAKLKKQKFKAKDLYLPLEELNRRHLSDNGKTAEAENEKAAIRKVYAALRQKVAGLDKSLLKHTDALEHRHLDKLDDLVKKMDRALRRSSQTELDRIRSARELLLPHGMPQERYYNFSEFYLAYGATFIRQIVQETDPFLHKHILLQRQAISV